MYYEIILRHNKAKWFNLEAAIFQYATLDLAYGQAL